MLPTSLPGGRPSGITGRAPDLAARGERGERGHGRGLQRCAAVELGERLVGAPVGNEHHVLHDLRW